MDVIGWINENILWGAPMLLLFTATGVIYTVRLGFFQFLHLPRIFKNTLFAGKSGGDGISPFRTLTAALGTTLGTGNIIAVGTALAFGGAGAVFWMWAAALLGMATCYGENAFGIAYRKDRGGVPFRYIKKALGGGRTGGLAAGMFALCCLLASFSAGNMVQVNSSAAVLNGTLGVPLAVTGACCAGLAFFLARGGLERLAGLTSWLIPLTSAIYIICCVSVMVINAARLPECFARIFTEAFSFRAAAGGAAGTALQSALSWGVKRGVFSNEAGLGTSVMIHAGSSSDSPAKEGNWAALQVFLDTIIMCTMTALCILSCGADALSINGTDMALIAFSDVLGDYAGIFLSVSVFIFAISTVGGWWVYGRTCAVYLFGEKSVMPYLIVYCAAAFIGAVTKAQAVWEISDMCNALMALPNLAALILMNKEICKYKE
ncbi:MAG: sodium:alanine symporter family protein [Eubacterium sp.]|nr:sodium:alanine symporter family protein [Eubacterium sp.]